MPKTKINSFMRFLLLLKLALEVITPIISQEIPEEETKGSMSVLLERADTHIISPALEKRSDPL